MKDICSPEAKAACPFSEARLCFSDKHHLYFYANRYKTHIEKAWRELPFNAVQVPRCVHNAIHASGYVPEKPGKEAMLDEIWNGQNEQAAGERDKQLEIGRIAMQGDFPPEAGEVAA